MRILATQEVWKRNVCREVRVVKKMSAVLGLGVFLASAAHAKPPPIEKVQKAYLKALSKRGLPAKLDEDGDVQFERDGYVYLITLDERDPNYFQLSLPHIWPIESEAQRLLVLDAANAATARTKVSKVYVLHDQVWANTELFLEGPLRFPDVLDRSLAAIDEAVNHFATQMRPEMEDEAEAAEEAPPMEEETEAAPDEAADDASDEASDTP